MPKQSVESQIIFEISEIFPFLFLLYKHKPIPYVTKINYIDLVKISQNEIQEISLLLQLYAMHIYSKAIDFL